MEADERVDGDALRLAWRRAVLRWPACPRSSRGRSRPAAAHDVNSLLGLLQRGCPAATALRISARDDGAPST